MGLALPSFKNLHLTLPRARGEDAAEAENGENDEHGVGAGEEGREALRCDMIIDCWNIVQVVNLSNSVLRILSSDVA
jgi:hypothetical protein